MDVRNRYPITRHDIYLNHAATAPIAQASITRMQAMAAEMERPLSEHFYRWLGVMEDTRRRLALLINAHPGEIAFCQNTSTGLSLIANAIPFQPGDKVLIPSNEFPSNRYIWQSLQHKGVTAEFFEVRTGVPIVDTLRQLSLQNVRLLSISAVSYLTGRLYELKEIAAFCREQGILSCFDTIQALGTVPFDVQIIQPDFIASGGQKWLLGSVGAGFIYARAEWLAQLQVPLVGWTSVQYPENFQLKELEFTQEMTRFEPGLPNILPIAALNQSLSDLALIGWENIYANIQQHTHYLSAALQTENIQPLAYPDAYAGIVAFELPQADKLETVVQALQKKRIHVTQRGQYIRVSPHFYNTQAELDDFLNILSIHARPSIIHSSPVPPRTTPTYILISGATGHVGSAFARDLAGKGYHLMLLGRDNQKLSALQQELQHKYAVTVLTSSIDLQDPAAVQACIQALAARPERYHVLINAAGIAEADTFLHLSLSSMQQMLQINCVAAFQLMQAFLTQLQAPQALGILNIVAATGRCGWPLLSGYAASQAALWSLSEVLARELCHHPHLAVTTYVAPPMHSPLQKRLGRIALRYFKLKGDFPYAQSTQVVQEAWQAFEKKTPLYVAKYHRVVLWLNTLFPSIIWKRIKKLLAQ